MYSPLRKYNLHISYNTSSQGFNITKSHCMSRCHEVELRLPCVSFFLADDCLVRSKQLPTSLADCYRGWSQPTNCHCGQRSRKRMCMTDLCLCMSRTLSGLMWLWEDRMPLGELTPVQPAGPNRSTPGTPCWDPTIYCSE